MFGTNVLTWPQIDPTVLDFPTFSALGNGGAQSVDFESEMCKNRGFSPLKFVRGHI